MEEKAGIWHVHLEEGVVRNVGEGYQQAEHKISFLRVHQVWGYLKFLADGCAPVKLTTFSCLG